MQGMILAAGFGTRLAPYTDNTPKALVKIADKPMLQHVIEKFINSGINKIIINAHYLRHQIVNFISASDFRADITVVTEKDILGTGGGIFNMLEYIDDDDFIVYNTDVICDIDLIDLMKYHKTNHALATMVMQDRDTFNQVVIDSENMFCGLKYIKKNTQIMAKEPAGKFNILAFCGIHAINKNIALYKPEENEFSIIKTYLDAVKKGENIISFSPDIYWKDIGTIEKLKQAEFYLETKKSES